MAIEPIKGFYVHDEATDTDGVAKIDVSALSHDIASELEQLATFDVVGRNLFDKSAVVSGYYKAYQDGVIRANVNYCYSDYIPVDGSQDYFLMPYQNNATWHVCFYDNTYSFIGGSLGSRVATPATCAYLVVSLPTPYLNDALLNSGTINIPYVPYTKTTTLKTSVIPQEIYNKLEKKLDYDIGKNLFNPNAHNKAVGVYVRYDNGGVYSNQNFEVVCIEVTAGDVLSFNTPNLHVCAFSDIPDLESISTNGGYFDGYINGFADSAPKQGYIVPENCICLTVSYNVNYINTLQVEIGETSTTYEHYIEGVKKNKVIGLSAETANVVYVGSGLDYETIQDAINNARDNATIFITNGTYDEAVDMRSSGKFLTLKGESRDGVILTHDGTDYYTPPLECGCGEVENMTIIRTGTDATSVGGAYSVHIDYDELRNSSLQFKNVRFINTNRQCVGIGLRDNCRLSFVQCELETDDNAAFYCHEEQHDNVSNQYVELIDCSLRRNSAGHVMVLQETPELSNNKATIRMQRCIVKDSTDSNDVIRATQYGTQPGLNGDGYLGTTLFTLDPMSALNNKEILNA